MFHLNAHLIASFRWVFQLQKLIKRIRQPLRVPMTRLQKPTPEQAAAKSSSLPVASQLLNVSYSVFLAP